MTQKQTTLNAFSIIGAIEKGHVSGVNRYDIGDIGRLTPLILLLFICLTPVVLVWSKLIPFEYRFHAFFCALAGLGYICFKRRYGFREIGFRTDNLKSALIWNLVFCAAGGIGVYMIYHAGIMRPEIRNYLPHVYLFYIFFLSPVQEIFFRGILFAELKRAGIHSTNLFLLVSTFSFCFLHIIYRHPLILIITFIGGLAWGIIFIKQPNIWAVSLSHSLLGALAMGFHLI
ncbi:MAG: CPBP family intramembrane glutamic endopeptidase [Desulfobacteraceae bacterium]